MEPDGLRKIGLTRFTDGGERDVFEDAEGRQFVRDDESEAGCGAVVAAGRRGEDCRDDRQKGRESIDELKRLQS